MMISPESFVEMELRGKDREKALKTVKNLRKEIKQLKKTIEEGQYSEEFEIKPSPLTRISVSRDYLDAAKAYFKSQGWVYEPSKKEIKDKEFNDRLKDLESIEIYYGGYFQGGKQWMISFDGSRIVVDSILRRMPDFEQSSLELPRFDDIKRAGFLRELLNLHMGEWKKEYYDPGVLDGTQWSVDIRYTDGKKRHFSGSNMFPYNFAEFLNIVREDDYKLNRE